MLRIGFLSLTLAGLVLLGTTESLTARSASSMRRELRRMVGYTIVASASIREIRDQRDGKYAVLDDGQVFKLNGATVALPYSDVVVFAKRGSAELRKQYPGMPERSYDSYKLLIDDEILEASPQ